MHFCILGQQQHFCISSLLLNSIYKFIYLYNHYYCLSFHGGELGVPPVIKSELISPLFADPSFLLVMQRHHSWFLQIQKTFYILQFLCVQLSPANLLEIILKTRPFISSFHVHSSISDHLISALHSKCKDYTLEMILNPVTTFSFLLDVSVPFS